MVQNLKITYRLKFRELLVQKLEQTLRTRKKWRASLLAMILVLSMNLITNRQILKAWELEINSLEVKKSE